MSFEKDQNWLQKSQTDNESYKLSEKFDFTVRK